MASASVPHVFHLIHSSYKQMSVKEKMIADYVLKNPEKIIHSTINQLSDNLQIADATVFRFCTHLGFKGYQAMKISLASELVTPIEDIHEDIKENDSETTIMNKVFQSNMTALAHTRDIQKEETLQEALNILLEAGQVHFYGSGGSGVTAQDGQHKFMRTGLSSLAYTDNHLQLMAASQLKPKDAAFFISHTGANKDLLEVLEVAKNRGARTIAITNYAKSPLTKQADISLYTVAEETEYRSEALASRIAELSLLDTLYVNYCVKRKQQTQEALSLIRDAISRKRL
ncbi:RpiR family transcriptional regulator [Sinobaca qinghaiensis]|uniref:RpiR family transcriptional regulator n=1 Tax=Sinobaca qinghaiensis TaxID=342944 RepID=A0A419V7S5_9BACL|nr:MurR/RpiR family transcriptional regulator [Sinobaca qinghaiensis]RKD76112.1 RpiR family transcriptional regulator [Sinobaca qinghaiensis]